MLNSAIAYAMAKEGASAPLILVSRLCYRLRYVDVLDAVAIKPYTQKLSGPKQLQYRTD